MLKKIFARNLLVGSLLAGFVPAYAGTITICSPALFRDADGGSQYIQIELAKPTLAESLALVKAIVSASTKEGRNQACIPTSASCYGTIQDSEFSFEQIKDKMGRVLGINGSNRKVAAGFRTKLGWNATITDEYQCAWGPSVPSVCRHVCTFQTKDIPGA